MKLQVWFLLFFVSAFAACKPRVDNSGLKEAVSASTVSVDREFLDSTTTDVETNRRKAGFLKSMSNEEMNEKRRSLYRDVATLSAAVSKTEFFQVLRPFYLADSSSYPAIYGRYIAFPQQVVNAGWGGGKKQGGTSNEVLKLNTVNGSLDQLAQAISSAAPAPAAAKPVAPQPTAPVTKQTEKAPSTDGKENASGPMAGAPVSPKANAVQTVKAQAEEQKPKQVVSTIVPPQVLAGAKGGSSEPSPRTSVSQVEASKNSGQDSYEVQDFCCYRSFYSRPGKKKKYYLTYSKYATLDLEGDTYELEASVRDGEICLDSAKLNDPVCFEILSESEVELDGVKWSTDPNRSL